MKNKTFEKWQQIGETLRRIEGSRLWWFGDWCNFGERRNLDASQRAMVAAKMANLPKGRPKKNTPNGGILSQPEAAKARKYGEKYSQALELGDYERGTLRNAAWVAGHIEMSRRRDNLSWSHHNEVADLEPEDQDREMSRRRDNLSWSHHLEVAGVDLVSCRGRIRGEVNVMDSKLKALRLAKHLTLGEVSDRSGVAISTVAALEKGRGLGWSAEIKRTVAAALGVTGAEFFELFPEELAKIQHVQGFLKK